MPWVCCRRRNQWLRLALASFCLPLMWQTVMVLVRPTVPSQQVALLPKKIFPHKLLADFRRSRISNQGSSRAAPGNACMPSGPSPKMAGCALQNTMAFKLRPAGVGHAHTRMCMHTHAHVQSAAVNGTHHHTQPCQKRTH